MPVITSNLRWEPRRSYAKSIPDEVRSLLQKFCNLRLKILSLMIWLRCNWRHQASRAVSPAGAIGVPVHFVWALCPRESYSLQSKTWFLPQMIWPWSQRAYHSQLQATWVFRLEVSGERELKFFPGLAKGAVYPGFTYETEAGTVAAPIAFKARSSSWQHHLSSGTCYCLGPATVCIFLDLKGSRQHEMHAMQWGSETPSWYLRWGLVIRMKIDPQRNLISRAEDFSAPKTSKIWWNPVHAICSYVKFLSNVLAHGILNSPLRCPGLNLCSSSRAIKQCCRHSQFGKASYSICVGQGAIFCRRSTCESKACFSSSENQVKLVRRISICWAFMHGIGWYLRRAGM